MLLAGHRIDLVLQHAHCADDARASLAGRDDVVHIAALGGDERVGQALAELVVLLPANGRLTAGAVCFSAAYEVVYAIRRARTAAGLPTMPTVRPSMRPKPTTIFLAQCSWTSKKSPSSTTRWMTSLMS